MANAPPCERTNLKPQDVDHAFRTDVGRYGDYRRRCLGVSATADAADDQAHFAEAPIWYAAANGSAVNALVTEPRLDIRRAVEGWAATQDSGASRTVQPGSVDDPKCRASLTEKVAFLYALVGGTVLIVYGPQEKEGGVWTRDGKSEAVAGGASIALSFALLRDIRRKGH